MGAAVAITRLDLTASELCKAIPYQWLHRYQTTCPRAVLMVSDHMIDRSDGRSTQDNNRAAGDDRDEALAGRNRRHAAPGR